MVLPGRQRASAPPCADRASPPRSRGPRRYREGRASPWGASSAQIAPVAELIAEPAQRIGPAEPGLSGGEQALQAFRIAGHHSHIADGDAVGALEGDRLAVAIHDVALLVVAADADADQRRAEAAVRQHAPG